MFQRPKAQESDEDLLRLQEEFLKQSGQPSMTTKVSKRKPESNTDQCDREITNERKDVQISQMETGIDNSNITNKRVKFNDKDRKDETEKLKASSSTWIEDGPAVETVLLDIIERDTTSVVVQPPTRPTGQPFPKIFRRDREVPQNKGQISIFAQQFQKFKVENMKRHTLKEETLPPSITKLVLSESKMEEGKETASGILDLGDTSCIIDGSGLSGGSDSNKVVKEIHEENLKRLSEMSLEEILLEQQQLIHALSPDLIQFLKSKRRKPNESDSMSDNNQIKISSPNASHAHAVYSSNEANKHYSVPSTFSTQHLEGNSFPSVSVADIQESELNVDELPIPINKTKQWLHMDKIEPEKLAWMTSLPQPKPIDPKTGYQARFDFEGTLVNHNVDVPVHHGLHHHGEEPEVAGYTLEELFIYARSVVLQQRVLGITTLSKIFSRCKEGWYDSCLSQTIIPQVLDAGIVPMLRWSLDDNTEGSLNATISALYTLIVSVPDEVSLDHTFLWYRGEETPFLQPSDNDLEKNKDPKTESEGELTDAELIKLDVIKGLLRMDLLIRLRYVLEVCRPAAPVVVEILEILIRIARHSLNSAFQIMRCPRLLQTIYTEFLPRTWTTVAHQSIEQQKIASAHGIPLPQAVKLIQVLASAGRHLADHLLHHYNVMDSILCYASIDPSEAYIPTNEAMKLCLASYKTWTVFLSYGFTVNSYLDFYPIIMRHLQYCQTIRLDVTSDKNSFNFDHAAALFKIMNAFTKSTLNEQEFDTHLLNYHPENLFLAAELCLKKWLWELTKADEITHSALRLVATVLGFISTFCEKYISKINCHSLEILNSIMNMYNMHLLPFMDSTVFKSLLAQLSHFSALGCSKENGRKRDPVTLPSLGSVLWDGHLCPVLDTKSPFCFLIQLTRCLYTCCHVHKNLNKMDSFIFLDHPAVLSYLRFIISAPNVTDASNWFARFETHFLYYLLMLCDLIKCKNLQIYHETAIYLIPKLQKGDEDAAVKLMSTIIFNLDFLSEYQELHTALEDLKLQERTSLATPLTIPEISHYRLLQHTCECIPSICDTYKYYFQIYLKIGQQKRWKEKDELCIPHIYDRLAPYDFFYLPITVLHQMMSEETELSKQRELIKDWEELNVLQGVTHCLQLCHLLETWRKDVLIRLSPSLRFCKLALVFLISSDLFLNIELRRYLSSNLHRMADRNELCSLKFDDSLKIELASFHDLYTQLLTQYESTSYGDHLFGMFILIPMQQHHSIFLRRSLWTEHLVIARSLGIEIKELLVPLKKFLFPIEDDKDLLLSYFKALINGSVQPKLCPVLYAIAVHHVHHFLFKCTVEKRKASLRRQLLSKLLQLQQDENVFTRHLLCYQEPNDSSDLGFRYSESPTEMVLQTIKEFESTS